MNLFCIWGSTRRVQRPCHNSESTHMYYRLAHYQVVWGAYLRDWASLRSGYCFRATFLSQYQPLFCGGNWNAGCNYWFLWKWTHGERTKLRSKNGLEGKELLSRRLKRNTIISLVAISTDSVMLRLIVNQVIVSVVFDQRCLLIFWNLEGWKCFKVKEFLSTWVSLLFCSFLFDAISLSQYCFWVFWIII